MKISFFIISLLFITSLICSIAYYGFFGSPNYKGQKITRALKSHTDKRMQEMFLECNLIGSKNKKDLPLRYYVGKGIHSKNTKDILYIRFSHYEIDMQEEYYTSHESAENKERKTIITIKGLQKKKEDRWVKLHGFWKENEINITVNVLPEILTKETEFRRPHQFFLPNEYIFQNSTKFTCQDIIN